MGIELIFTVLSGLLLLGTPYSWAQSGYNYVRPDVGLTGGGATGAVPNSVQNPLRPLVTGSSGSVVPSAFAPSSTAFGGVTPNPTTAFSPFSQTPAQRTITPAPTNLLQSGNALTSRQQTTLAQRPNTQAGIYGQQNFISSGRGGLSGTGGSAPGSSGYSSDDYNDGSGDFSAIPGVPGVDYPIYSQVPPTNFDCAQQALPGYYSDIEAQCQVFHICALNRTYSFLCPNGTLFSQETLVCVWWNQYDCASAPSLYANNAFIYDYSNQGQGTQQQQQLSSSAGRQQQPNYPSVRSGSVYGGGYNQQAVATSAITPATTTGLPSTGISGGVNSASRFQPNIGITGSTLGQTFPTASSVATPSPFSGNPTSSLVGRGTLPTTVQAGGSATAAGRTSYPNAQITTTSNNREYLPPRRP